MLYPLAASAIICFSPNFVRFVGGQTTAWSPAWIEEVFCKAAVLSLKEIFHLATIDHLNATSCSVSLAVVGNFLAFRFKLMFSVNPFLLDESPTVHNRVFFVQLGIKCVHECEKTLFLVSGLCFIRNSFSNLMTNQEAWFRAEPQAVCGKNDAQCYIYFHHLWWAVHVRHLLPAKFWVIPLKVHLAPKNHFSLSSFQSKGLILDEQSCLFQPLQDFVSFLGVEREEKKKKRKNAGKSAAYDAESNPAISCTLRQSAALSIFGDGICMKGKPGLMDLDWCWDSFVLA